MIQLRAIFLSNEDVKIQLRAIFLSNEDVNGSFSDVSEALDNLKPEAWQEMIDADVALFNGVVVKNRFNTIVRAA